MAANYDFVVTLKHGSYRLFNYVSNLVLLMSVAVFIYTAIIDVATRIYFAAAVGAVILYWLYLQLILDKKEEIVYYRGALFIASIGWANTTNGNYWIAAMIAILALLERQVKFPQEIGVSSGGITFNTFPAKRFSWNVLSNVIIKDGIITLDYKNNKIVQREIEEDVEPNTEREFNMFCSKQIQAQQQHIYQKQA